MVPLDDTPDVSPHPVLASSDCFLDEVSRVSPFTLSHRDEFRAAMLLMGVCLRVRACACSNLCERKKDSNKRHACERVCMEAC